ncbi:MAG TPA: tyrosine-type recombinase/integrase [Solirubrobacteraceae bacterium]|nr:tyrosine-type recombinase/integrase [Solirubrobacteraceae bacterium]
MRWLHAARDLSPHTLRAYEADVLALEKHLGRQARVRRVNRDCLVSFVEWLRDEGLSPSSIRRRLAGVRGFCRWLLAHQLLEDDPLIGLTIPTGRRRALPRVIPAHEIDRLFRYLQRAALVTDQPRPMAIRARPHHTTTLLGVALMLTTGVRVHEVVGITCADIDLQAQSIRILGKGRRERQVFLSNSWLTGLTMMYLQVRSELGIRHQWLLFNSLYDPLTTQAMRSRLGKAADVAGLKLRITPHMLRHTAATQLMDAGVDIRYIQRLLGHASLTTTELYTHVSDSALKRVVTAADTLELMLQ